MNSDVVMSTFYMDYKDMTERMARSFSYWHKDVAIVIEHGDRIVRLRRNHRPDYIEAEIGKDLAKTYKMVIHIDGDSVVTAPLDEVFAMDFDVAAPRNNNDVDRNGQYAPIIHRDIGIQQYVNCGLHAATRQEFWDDWSYANATDNGYCPFGEQDTLNEVFWSGKYKAKVLDPKEANFYYGIATLEGAGSCWDSWKRITLQDDRIYLNGKQVKVLHMAGGHLKPPFVFDDLFRPDVSDWLKKITA